MKMNCLNQGKNCLIVQDAESFASAAKKLTSSTKIIHIGEPEIVTCKDRKPFQGAIKVKGISKMHVMKVVGEKHPSGKIVHLKLILKLLRSFLTMERVWELWKVYMSMFMIPATNQLFNQYPLMM